MEEGMSPVLERLVGSKGSNVLEAWVTLSCFQCKWNDRLK